jgi:hypothetical protein
MKTITRTYGPLTAILSDAGQLPATDSDDVKIDCQLRLPREKFGLRRGLQFGSRVIMVGEPLHYDWGSTISDTTGDYRYKGRSFSAPTYQQAIADADLWVRDEAEKLLAAIYARERALTLAGSFDGS